MATTLILVCVGLFILMVIFFTIKNRRKEQERRDFIAGVNRGLEDYRVGKMKPWSEVKKSLGKGGS